MPERKSDSPPLIEVKLREKQETAEKIILSAFFQLCDYYRLFKEMKPETWLEEHTKEEWAKKKIKPAEWQEKELPEIRKNYQQVLSELESVLNRFFASPFLQSIFQREFNQEIRSLEAAERISQKTLEPFFQQFKKTEPKADYQAGYTFSSQAFQDDFSQALITATEANPEWEIVLKKLTFLSLEDRQQIKEYFKIRETGSQKQKETALKNLLNLGDPKRFEVRYSKLELEEEVGKEQEMIALIAQTDHLKLILNDYKTKWLPKLEQADQPFISAVETAKRKAEERARLEELKRKAKEEVKAKAEAEKRTKEEAEWKAKIERGELPRGLTVTINPGVFAEIKQTNPDLKGKDREVRLDFKKIRERAIDLYLKAGYHKKLRMSEEEYRRTFPRLEEHLTPEKLSLIKEKIEKEGFNDILIVDNRLPLSKQFELLIQKDTKNFPSTLTFTDDLNSIKELDWSKITSETEITAQNIQEFQKDKESGLEIVLVQKYQFTNAKDRGKTATVQIKEFAAEENTGLTLENYLPEIKNFLKENGKYMDTDEGQLSQCARLLGSVAGANLLRAHWYPDDHGLGVNVSGPGHSSGWLAGRRRVVLKKLRT